MRPREHSPLCDLGERTQPTKLQRQRRRGKNKKAPEGAFDCGTPPAGALTHAVLFQLLTQSTAVDAHQVGSAGLVAASVFHHFF